MNAAAIGTIAASTVSLLVPYLRKAAEGAATSIGEAAWEGARQLYTTIKATLSSIPAGIGVIESLEATPDDSDAQAALRFQLKAAMSHDHELASKLADLLKNACEAGADSVFHTTIHGEVKKLVQMGNVYGNVKI